MEFLRDNPQLLLVGGLLLIVMCFMSRLKKRRRVGGVSILTPQEQLERLKQARGMRGDLEQLMVEIEQMAKRMAAHLDAKSAYLQRLLDQADERIETLRALERQREPSRLEESQRDGGVVRGAGVSQLQQGRRARQGLDVVVGDGVTADAAGAGAAGTGSDGGAGSADAVDALPLDPLARQVYELADQGKAAAQIARQLDEHVGKIELILALRSA